jgi:predicted nuclease of predicted toxin-antitoxin system
MKILIDECLPKKLKLELPDHFVQTVPEAGWAGKQNGDLLRLAEKDFDVLLTNDQNMEHQQHLKQFDLAYIVLAATTNDINDLKPLMPAVNEVLRNIKVGQIEYVR